MWDYSIREKPAAGKVRPGRGGLRQERDLGFPLPAMGSPWKVDKPVGCLGLVSLSWACLWGRRAGGGHVGQCRRGSGNPSLWGLVILAWVGGVEGELDESHRGAQATPPRGSQ